MIEIVHPGALATIQDLGRYNLAHQAVSAGGAADPLSLMLGNRLVGNEPDAAGLEMTLRGATLRFDADATIALTGAPFESALALWQAHAIKAGQTLRIGSASVGIRCYLAAAGGVHGPANQPLRSGDRLVIGEPHQRRPRAIDPDWIPRFNHQPVRLRVTPGAQFDRFPDAVTQLSAHQYAVSSDSNRMGIRLEGQPLTSQGSTQLITEGVPLGAIQVPDSGQPIILFVDQQTTGGYAKIASVISRDLHKLGQLRPRDRVRFEFVTLEEARRLYREWHLELFD